MVVEYLGILETYQVCATNDGESTALTLDKETGSASRVVPSESVRSGRSRKVEDVSCAWAGQHVDVWSRDVESRVLVCRVGDPEQLG